MTHKQSKRSRARWLPSLDSVALAAWTVDDHARERALWLECLGILLPTLFEVSPSELNGHLQLAVVEELDSLYAQSHGKTQLNLSFLLHHISGELSLRMAHGYEFGLACFWDTPVLATKLHQLALFKHGKSKREIKRNTQLKLWIKSFMQHKDDDDFLEDLAAWKSVFHDLIAEQHSPDHGVHEAHDQTDFAHTEAEERPRRPSLKKNRSPKDEASETKERTEKQTKNKIKNPSRTNRSTA